MILKSQSIIIIICRQGQVKVKWGTRGTTCSVLWDKAIPVYESSVFSNCSGKSLNNLQRFIWQDFARGQEPHLVGVDLYHYEEMLWAGADLVQVSLSRSQTAWLQSRTSQIWDQSLEKVRRRSGQKRDIKLDQEILVSFCSYGRSQLGKNRTIYIFL